MTGRSRFTSAEDCTYSHDAKFWAKLGIKRESVKKAWASKASPIVVRNELEQANRGRDDHTSGSRCGRSDSRGDSNCDSGEATTMGIVAAEVEAVNKAMTGAVVTEKGVATATGEMELGVAPSAAAGAPVEAESVESAATRKEAIGVAATTTNDGAHPARSARQEVWRRARGPVTGRGGDPRSRGSAAFATPTRCI